MPPLFQFQRTAHRGFEIGCVVKKDTVYEPGNVKQTGQGITTVGTVNAAAYYAGKHSCTPSFSRSPLVC